MRTSTKICILLTFVLYLGCNSKPKGKHLFILSGQSNMVGLNVNTSFSPLVEAEFGKQNTILVKDAMGGQSIRRWYKAWRPANGDTPKSTGDLYDRLMLKVNKTIKDQDIATVTFIWMQGERDARMKNSAVYEKSLLGLHQQLNNDLNRNDINLVIGRLNDFDMKNEKWPHWTLIRDIQVKVGESQPNFGWIDTDDLNDGLNANGDTINNDLHMSVEGYKIMGKRFAKKAIQLIEANN